MKVFQRTPGWVMPRVDVGDACGRQARLRTHADRAAGGARPHCSSAHEAAATGLVWDTPITTLIQQAGEAAPADDGQGQVAAPTAHPGLPGRLQADADVQRLLPRAAARQLQADHVADRHDHAEGMQTSDGLRARGGRDRLRHRLRRPPRAVRRIPITGMDGAVAAGGVVRAPAGVQERQRARLPEPVLHLRSRTRARATTRCWSTSRVRSSTPSPGIRAIVEQDLRWLDVRKDVQDGYNASMQKRLRSTTWMSGCTSWYLTADGFNASMYPGFRHPVPSSDAGLPDP